jgi:hypothetical protein|nr:MAG TPA: hypothetical protein [Bacteriophage sp.]
MTKAVLIMDMPEQVCQKCTLCYETENDDEYLCCVTGKLLPDGEKPDWCPLLEFPKHKRTIGTESESNRILMNVGYNACLDEILKEKKVGDSE